MLLYVREAEVAVKMFNDFAYKKQSKTLQVSITDNNTNTERTARKYIQKGMAEVRLDEYDISFDSLGVNITLCFMNQLVHI